MVIAANSPLFSGPYDGDGVTTVFDYDFRIYANTELLVVRTNADETTDTFELATDYTVTGVGEDAGGTVVLTSAALLPVGATMTVEPNVTASQERPFSAQTSITLSQIEVALDKLTSLGRQLLSASDRSLRVAVDAAGPPPLPTPVDGKVLMGNATGDGYVNGPSAATIADAEGIAADAAASAAAASASAVLAATFDPALYLAKANNLSGLAIPDTALTNLGGTTAGIALFKSANVAAQRTALGVAATTDDDDLDTDPDNTPTRANVAAAIGASNTNGLIAQFEASGNEIVVTDIPEPGTASGQYAEVFLVLDFLRVTGVDGAIQVEYSFDNGTTWTSTSYQWVTEGRDSHGVARSANSNSDSKWVITPTDVDTYSKSSLMGRLYLNGEINRMTGVVSYTSPSNYLVTAQVACGRTSGTFNALRFTAVGAANLQYGTISLYGINPVA